MSIILSGADAAIFVHRNGLEIGRAPISEFKVKGSHAYSALAGVDPDGVHHWLSTMNVGGREPNVKKMAKRLVFSSEFLKRTRALIVPGTTLILTELFVGVKRENAPNLYIYSDNRISPINALACSSLAAPLAHSRKASQRRRGGIGGEHQSLR